MKMEMQNLPLYSVFVWLDFSALKFKYPKKCPFTYQAPYCLSCSIHSFAGYIEGW